MDTQIRDALSGLSDGSVEMVYIRYDDKTNLYYCTLKLKEDNEHNQRALRSDALREFLSRGKT